jgi:hypothetical protein
MYMAISGTRAIRVKALEGSQIKFNICVPVTLARVVLRVIPKEISARLNELGIDVAQLICEVSEGFDGKILDYSDDKTRVEVFSEAWK